MPVAAAVVGAAASVGTALIGASAAKKASAPQASAAKKAIRTQQQMYETARADLGPYREGGGEGLYSVLDMFGMRSPRNPDGSTPFAQKAWEAFQATPYYQNPLKAYIGAADQTAAARGNLLSSGHLKRVGELASDYATRQFGSYMDRLYALAGMGKEAAGSTAQAALNTGSNIANTQLAQGEAQASGTVGSANALSSGVAGLGSNLAYYLASRPTTGYSLAPSQA